MTKKISEEILTKLVSAAKEALVSETTGGIKNYNVLTQTSPTGILCDAIFAMTGENIGMADFEDSICMKLLRSNVEPETIAKIICMMDGGKEGCW